ncbi:unnamed protein product [Coregonus sp. 'balchen']|nr:unnamed protein product [Coregonus sp. 'balchen']
MEKMKAYFCLIKGLQPRVSEEVNSILSRYYQLQKHSNRRNAARTTNHMLESLSRLAEAHARLMFRDTVTVEDAVVVVSVTECTMQFPDNPSQQYQTQCQIVLEGLQLPHILNKEMDRLSRLQNNGPCSPKEAVGGGSTSRYLIDHVEQAFSTDSLPSHSTPRAGKKRNSKKNNVPYNLPTPLILWGHGEKNCTLKCTGFTFKPLCSYPDSSDVHTENREKERTEKEKGDKQFYKDRPAEGSSAAKKLRLRVQSEENDFPTEVPCDLRAEGGGGGGGGNHGAEQKRQQLLSRPSGKNRTTSTTRTEPPPPPLQPDHPKPTVAASTLAKLSRFSFTTTKDQEVKTPKTTPTSGAQTVNSKVQTPAGDSAGNPKKRKCFELGSKGPFSGFSMFSSSIFDYDDLDVDWDEESGKKAKM